MCNVISFLRACSFSHLDSSKPKLTPHLSNAMTSAPIELTREKGQQKPQDRAVQTCAQISQSEQKLLEAYEYLLAIRIIEQSRTLLSLGTLMSCVCVCCVHQLQKLG